MATRTDVLLSLIHELNRAEQQIAALTGTIDHRVAETKASIADSKAQVRAREEPDWPVSKDGSLLSR